MKERIEKGGYKREEKREEWGRKDELKRRKDTFWMGSKEE